MNRRFHPLLLCLGAWCLVSPAVAKDDPVPDIVQFNRDIRPILAAHCFECHGADGVARKRDLRLDRPESALSESRQPRVVVPGQPKESELFRRITATKDDDRMPPRRTGRKLPAREVQLLERWIQQGAKWEPHWAHLPPDRPAVPAVKNTAWVANPIDAFVLARLEKERVRPSPEADPRTLIRRLTLDLAGLPPAPREVEQFLADKGARSYAKVVDRLLESPQFGERMAMFWLDAFPRANAAAFGLNDTAMLAAYREQVVRAFNENVPFDRFTREVIAGDLLPGATSAQRAAAGFQRLSAVDDSASAGLLAHYAAERARAVAATWLGASLACAECHEHKFDSFTTADFQRFAAFFTGGAPPSNTLASQSNADNSTHALDTEIAALQRTLETTTPELAASQAAWEQFLLTEHRTGWLAWESLKPATAVSDSGATLTIEDDGVVAAGAAPANDTFTITLKTDRQYLTALRLEVFPERDGGAAFALAEFEASLAREEAGEPARFSRASANVAEVNHPVGDAIDGSKTTAWAGSSASLPPRAAFVFEKPLPGGPGTTLAVSLRHTPTEGRALRRFRLSVISADRPTHDDHGLPDGVLKILLSPANRRTASESETLARYYRSIAPGLDAARARLAEKTSQRAQWRPLTAAANSSASPRDDAAPALPRSLGARSPDAHATRLDLAQWLTARDNPLTARVFVNRVWQLCFGAGLARNVDDLGAATEWPAHRELLDWLACEFRDSGWNVKQLMRLIVTSNTYRQSSEADSRWLEIDPQNRWLARQNAFAIDERIVRDAALSVSGLLLRNANGPEEHRRSIYARAWQPPLRDARDIAGRELCPTLRAMPRQVHAAPTLADDAGFAEAVRVFAERVLRQGGDEFARQLDWAFTEALSRQPTSKESRAFEASFRKSFLDFHRQPDEARRILTAGLRPIPKDLNQSELAAWILLARNMLSVEQGGRN
ncbi:MAG: PSD1 and planctomycete cytochrome C domain-containing protein [Verrucomicrobiota bacterium]